MFVHEIMNDSISSSADVRRLFTSTAMSHFWHTCLKKVRYILHMMDISGQ